MINRNIVFLSLLLLAIFISCQEDNLEIDVQAEVPVLKRVVITGQPIYEFSYNNKDIIGEEKSTFNYNKYNYNDKDQLLTTDYYSDKDLLSSDLTVLENALSKKGILSIVDSEKGGALEYKYDIYGQLLRTIFSRTSGGNAEYSEFTYDFNGRIGRQTFLWDNKIAGYVDYLYDAQGNLIRETLSSISSAGLPELNTTTQYEFDSYKNPFKAFYRLMTPGINTNPNNIIKETLTIHFKPGQGTNIVRSTLSSYTYNSKGYPVKKNGNIEFLYE